MKSFLIFIMLLSSSFAVAQTKFKVSSNKNLIRDLSPYKVLHQQILRSYKSQIDSEISRLITGLEYEINSKSDKFVIKQYEQLLAKLLVKRILINELQNQLAPVNLNDFAYNKKGLKVFQTEKLKINLEKEITIQLDEFAKKNTLGYHFISDLKTRIVRVTLLDLSFDTFKAIGSGLMAQIIAQGVSGAAFKTAMISLGSDIFVSVGVGTILNILTFPLHAYRAPPESIWNDILRKNPEMIINPEWMRYAGSNDDPWFTHAYSLLRNTDEMEKAMDKLLKNEEQSFIKTVIAVDKYKNFKPESTKKPLIVQDNTYVVKPRIIDLPPFWAMRLK